MPYVAIRPKGMKEQVVAAHHKVVENVVVLNGEKRDGVPVQSKKRAMHVKRVMDWNKVIPVDKDDLDVECQDANIPNNPDESPHPTERLSARDVLEEMSYSSIKTECEEIMEQGGPEIALNSSKEELIDYLIEHR